MAKGALNVVTRIGTEAIKLLVSYRPSGCYYDYDYNAQIAHTTLEAAFWIDSEIIEALPPTFETGIQLFDRSLLAADSWLDVIEEVYYSDKR